MLHISAVRDAQVTKIVFRLVSFEQLFGFLPRQMKKMFLKLDNQFNVL
jgi:hypothetical protein